jgi:hypothetical protein
MNLVYYLRPFKHGSAVVRLFYVEVQHELRFFTCILAFVLFGFSQALYLLAQGDATNDFATSDGSYLNAFLYMLGSFDFSQFNQSENFQLAIGILTLLVTVTTIMLLNLLVGILSKY